SLQPPALRRSFHRCNAAERTLQASVSLNQLRTRMFRAADSSKEGCTMNRFVRLTPKAARGWVAALGAAGLIGGAAWSGYAVSPHAATPAENPAPISHAIAAGRDSYADVVDVVSPAVVTVHAT